MRISATEPLVPRRARMAYALSSLPSNAISQAWALWLIYFYAPPADSSLPTRVPELFGLDPRLVLGITITLARLLEALDDPLVGYWSDRTKSRWGRRIPFVVIGTPIWVLLFVLLFTPPVEGASATNLGFLFIVGVAFFLMSNLSGAPLEALLPQFARSHEDRLSVGSWQVMFGVTGAVVGLSMSSLVQGWFGFTAMAITVAAIACVARYASILGIWRQAKADRTPASGDFSQALRETFSNPQFLAFLPSFVAFNVGLQLLTALLPFAVDTVLAEAELFGLDAAGDSGVFTFALTAAVIAGMLTSVPFFRAFARRRGKAYVYRRAMLAAAAYFPLLFFLGEVPGLPLAVQGLLMVFLAGIPTAGVYLFPGLLTADIADYDETRTETRREAMFYGAQNQLEKLATAVAPLLFALILLAGDSREDPLGIRLVGPVAGAAVLLGYWGFRRYSLPDTGSAEMATDGETRG